jgi:D-glycero-D-manno-heptose 1,7-bisphosphate phosphatase
LVERAATELGFDPAKAWVIGDNANDIELGHRVGATTILVRTGHGAAVESEVGSLADYVTDDLPAAALLIEGLIGSTEGA